MQNFHDQPVYVGQVNLSYNSPMKVWKVHTTAIYLE